jgi:hypothetical protein
MKYISLIAASVFVIACNSVFAQASLPAGKPVKRGNEWKMPGDALTRSKKFTDDLKSNLGLDDATSQKVFKAYLANTKSVDEIPALPISEDEKTNRLKTNKLAFDETLKGILTPEQFDKYLKKEADMKQHK